MSSGLDGSEGNTHADERGTGVARSLAVQLFFLLMANRKAHECKTGKQTGREADGRERAHRERERERGREGERERGN